MGVKKPCETTVPLAVIIFGHNLRTSQETESAYLPRGDKISAAGAVELVSEIIQRWETVIVRQLALAVVQLAQPKEQDGGIIPGCDRG
jgi:hypothetical protein